MSIKNCQAIQKSWLDHECNACFTLGSEYNNVNKNTQIWRNEEQKVDK